MIKLLLNIFFISYLATNAQNNPIKLPRFSLRGNIGIPKVVSSKAFRNSFSAVGTADLNVNSKLFSNFFAGIGYSYTYFKSQKYFRDININTNLQSQNVYLKLGYDCFFKDDAFATFSLNTGYNINKYAEIHYKNDSIKGLYPTQFKSNFIEPMVGIYFIVDPNFAIGAHLSYNYNLSKFNSKLPAFDKLYNYDHVSNNWNMSMITFGFGFYYGLAKK